MIWVQIIYRVLAFAGLAAFIYGLFGGRVFGYPFAPVILREAKFVLIAAILFGAAILPAAMLQRWVDVGAGISLCLGCCYIRFFKIPKEVSYLKRVDSEIAALRAETERLKRETEQIKRKTGHLEIISRGREIEKPN